MNNVKKFGPKELRGILIAILFTALVCGAGAYYLGLGMVRDYSKEVNQRLVDAEASGSQLDKLQALKSQLAQSNLLINKADLLLAPADSHQAQVLSDLKRYADLSSVSIESTNFESKDGNYAVKVKLRSPAPYRNLISFLDLVEGNLPKMQVKNMSISRSGNGGNVSVQEIKIGVSVR